MLTEFWGWTESELRTALRKAQDDLARGSSITAAGAGDVSSQSLVTNNARERIRMLQNALYELGYAEFAGVNANMTIPTFS